VEPRLNIVTLGVIDVPAARAFYKRLGFKPSSAGNESVAFFEADGVVLALFGERALAEDAKLAPPAARPAFRGVSLAHNVATKEDVDRVIENAVTAGAKLVKKAEDVFWGGCSGYFADPDGHLWEVAWNPFSPLDEKGRVQLPA
jgi:hypothetical protein